ncbi:MAG: proline--tRNA ligase [Clostridiales bacterium]|jgi:prolyl-tRNA synthetase|nr:proline--tRNA ligase [Clostridiales bacterium]
MKIDKLVGTRFKQKPSDCDIESHAIMMRGGYMKNVSNGIFSFYTPLVRIVKNLEQIIRDEMDMLNGQEVLFPIVLPASFGEKLERYDGLGDKLISFTDHSKNPLVYGLAYEEAAVNLVRDYGNSYINYPFMIFQIQTKVSDEPRVKGGLIKSREFSTKDAYSFHVSRDDLSEFYEKIVQAYKRIFDKAGVSNVIPVLSSSGMFDDTISHEFVFMTSVGDDFIAICNECNYRSNLEAAECIVENNRDDFSDSLVLEHTPGVTTVDEVCEFLKRPKNKVCKAVVYQKNDGNYVIVFIRGDLDISEFKLKNHIRCDIHPAILDDSSGLCAGYMGPYKLSINKGNTILFDKSLLGANNLLCGANQTEYHFTGLDISRDVGEIEYFDFAEIIDGGTCPICNKQSISISRGIKVGSVIQTNTKYTKTLDMQYLDKNGQPNFPLMGIYKIEVDKLIAAICEANHDEYGPMWPPHLSPWQVHLCAVRSDDAEVKSVADNLYSELIENGLSVIYDDRSVSAGVMFSDADLLGAPLRVIVSPRNIKENCCEIVSRDKNISCKQAVESSKEKIIELVKNMIL